jgi:hypothetical protein
MSKLFILGVAILAIAFATPYSAIADTTQSTTILAKPESLPRPLPAEQFFGMAGLSYAAANSTPLVLSKLFCYCGCDVIDAHRNLLDCFIDMHGADCDICQREALLAFQLDRNKISLSEIQKQVDDQYSKQYRFETPSAALINYRASKLYGSNSATGGSAATGPGSCCNPTKSGE